MLEKILNFLFSPFRIDNNEVFDKNTDNIDIEMSNTTPVADVVLVREKTTDTGTYGKMYYEDIYGKLHTWETLELPWRSNERRMSCIPAGTYHAVYHTSPKFGKTYWIQDVPNRSEILIHTGNVAGDTKLGYKSDVDGCILVGEQRGILYGQNAVLRSRLAMNTLLNVFPKPKIIIQIKNFDEE